MKGEEDNMECSHSATDDFGHCENFGEFLPYRPKPWLTLLTKIIMVTMLASLLGGAALLTLALLFRR